MPGFNADETIPSVRRLYIECHDTPEWIQTFLEKNCFLIMNALIILMLIFNIALPLLKINITMDIMQL